MNIIFLDVDGVLNCSDTFKRTNKIRKLLYKLTNDFTFEYYFHIDLRCLFNLKKVVKKTNAKIVLSSTWRYYFVNHPDNQEQKIALERMLKLASLEIMDVTTIYNKNCKTRGDEIALWVKQNNYLDIDNFIVLDDDDDDLERFGSHFIKTKFHKKGLTRKLAKIAIKSLNKKEDY